MSWEQIQEREDCRDNYLGGEPTPPPSTVYHPLNLINATQHDQTKPLQAWNKLGVTFANPAFTPWGVISPKTNLRQAVKNAWGLIQEEWARCRSIGQIPNGLLIGGWSPITIPIAAWLYGQALPPVLVAAVQAPAPMVDGKRRPPILAGWRVLPPQGVIIREGQPLPPKRNLYQLKNMIHVSARPLVDDRAATLANFSPLPVIAPCLPALPPLPEADLDAYERQIVGYIDAAQDHSAAILLDGPPVESAIRIGLLARSYGVKVCYVRTGDPVPGSIPAVVGIEELNWY